MYVLTECAFLTPRSSAIWLDSDKKKLNCKEETHVSGPVSQNKRLKRLVANNHFHVKKIYLASKRNYETTLFYFTLFSLVKRCKDCGLSFIFLYSW